LGYALIQAETDGIDDPHVALDVRWGRMELHGADNNGDQLACPGWKGAVK
jgi:hypothetical protein